MPLDEAAMRKIYTETKQQLETGLKLNTARAKKLKKAESSELPRKSMQRVFFAFMPSPSTNPKDGILKAHTKQKEPALEKAVTTLVPKPKELCSGMAAVVLLNKKPVIMITSYKKKATSAAKKIHDYLNAWHMQYIVTEKLPAEGEEDEVEEQSDDEDGTDAASSSQSDDGSEADESGEGEEAESEEAPATTAASQTADAGKAKIAALVGARKVWEATADRILKNVDQLTAAIRKEYASEPPQVVADIENGMGKLRAAAARFDRRLADALDSMSNAKDAAARKTEAAKAVAIINEYKGHSNDPTIKHIDENPFGVQTNLAKLADLATEQVKKAIASAIS